MEVSSTSDLRPTRRDFALLLTVAVVGNGFVAYLIWNAATPGRRERTSGIFAGVVLAGMLAFAGWRRRNRVAAATAVGASLLLSALLLFLLPDRAIERQWHDAQAQASAIADRVIADAHGVPGCEQPIVSIPVFGRPDRLCVEIYLGSEHFRPGATVSFLRHDGDTYYGLLYHTAEGSPFAADDCVRHLGGPWWEVSSDEWHCPPGFDIQPF